MSPLVHSIFESRMHFFCGMSEEKGALTGNDKYITELWQAEIAFNDKILVKNDFKEKIKFILTAPTKR